MANSCRLHRQLMENENLIDTLISPPSLLHGAIPEKQRQAIINRFQSGDIKYLICTDLASRGLDTTQVSIQGVLHFDSSRLGVPCDHV